MSEKWDAEAPSDKDERIVWEAKKRFQRCQEWESQAEANGDDDEKFANGDSINNWQWPQEVINARGQNRPKLTINKTRQHCLQIINDARQNKSSVKIIAVGDGATADAAQVFMGVVRHIENLSNATAAYDNATWHQVIRGIGYWRILTDYAHDGTFDQEIYIRRVPNPKSVRIDPDIQEADGSDARFGFVFVDLPRDEFERKYPNIDVAGPGIDAGDDWVRKDTIRVAEYYRQVETVDRLLALKDGTVALASELQERPAPEDIAQERDVPSITVEHYKIAGIEIVERAIWPSRYIPIVRVIGEETVIDGKLDRKGHVRALRDPQRMYNYWSSAATEHVALQSKVPYITDPAAIEGYETIWSTANTVNHAYLPYKRWGDDGRENALPARLPPPVMPDAYLKGIQVTQQEMLMVSGQYAAEMGAPSNERSGVAIERRQRQSDNATYHFVDRQAQAIRFTGRILVDLIPKIYDTPRVVRILAEDGTESHVQVDPNAQAAHQEQPSPDPATQAAVIFNPGIGTYGVEADIGPAFATARQEMAQAFGQVLASNKELAPFIADLWMKSLDLPGADEAAKRLRAMVPPAALAADDPAVAMLTQQAKQQVEHLQQQLQQMAQQLAAAKSDRSRDDERVVIDAFRAETDRLSAVAPALTPDDLRPVVAQLIAEMMQTALQPGGGQMMPNNQMAAGPTGAPGGM